MGSRAGFATRMGTRRPGAPLVLAAALFLGGAGRSVAQAPLPERSIVYSQPAGVVPRDSVARTDSVHPRVSRATHVRVGMLAGAALGGAVGAVVGVIADQQASNSRVQWSGGGVVLGALGVVAGAVIGGVVGAVLPHS